MTAELLQQILAKGCQYLSLYLCCIEKNNLRRFEKNFKLKYLCILHCQEYDGSLESPWDSFDILPDFAASCYGLEKLSIRLKNFSDPILFCISLGLLALSYISTKRTAFSDLLNLRGN